MLSRERFFGLEVSPSIAPMSTVSCKLDIRPTACCYLSHNLYPCCYDTALSKNEGQPKLWVRFQVRFFLVVFPHTRAVERVVSQWVFTMRRVFLPVFFSGSLYETVRPKCSFVSIFSDPCPGTKLAEYFMCFIPSYVGTL